MDEISNVQYEDLLIEIADLQIEIVDHLSSIYLVNMGLLLILVTIFLWLFLSKIFVSRSRKL